MKFHRLLGVSILPALLVMPAMATDYNMTDGTKIVLTADETITNTIDLGSNRKAAIQVNGTNSIDTGENTLTVNASGATGRNVVVENTTANSDFVFTGNLIGNVVGVDGAEARALRAGGVGSKSKYDGVIKINTTAAGIDSMGIQAWNGADMSFAGALTDISALGLNISGRSRAVQVYDAGGAKVTLSADKTTLNADGIGYVEGIFAHQGKVYVNGDTDIIAKNGVDTRGIGVQSDAKPADIANNAGVYLDANEINVTSTTNNGSALGLFASGSYSTIESDAQNLNVNVNAEGGYAQGVVSQYGANVNLASGTNTTVDVISDSVAYGVSSQNGWGKPGHFTSHGDLTVSAKGESGGYGVFVSNDSAFSADKLTSTGTATGEDAYGIGMFIKDSSDVVIGSEGKKSSLNGIAENGVGIGLYLHESSEDKTSATLKGNMLVDGASVGVNIASGTLTNDAELTVKNGLANSGAFINNNKMVVESDIYNDGTFTNNSVLNVDGIIYNATNGVLTIASGTTSIDGGITGDGSLTIDEGATLNVGTASIKQGSMTLAENSTLNATLLNVNNYASFNVENLNADENSEFNLTLKGVGSYNVFKNAVTSVNVDYDNNLFDIAWNENKDTITVSTKSTEEIASNTHIAHESAAAVSHIASAASVSESKQLQELSLKLQEKLANGDTASVEHATKAVHPETESVAQSVSSSVQNTVVNAAAARMAMPAIGRSAGDVNLTSGAVWAQGIFNKTKQNDAFHGYTRGIAAGLDGTINKVWTIGAAYSFAHSDVTGSARDTEIDSNTLFIYGQYKPSEWYLNAIANYTWSDYSENGSVIDGALVSADYDVQSFGGHIATGYNFHNGITPELGLRYMHVNADDYTNSYGIKTSMKDTDFLTGMAGAKYAFDITSGKHAKFTPELKAGVKYDLLSDKSVATIAMPGVNAYSLDGNRLNRLGGEFGIGFGMTYDNLQLSINYDIDVRKDYTSQTGMLKFRYSF